MPIASTLSPVIAGGITSTLGQGGGYVFINSEAAALVARFTTPPTNSRKLAIDTLIGALKTAGVWSKLDALYLTAAADSQAARRNWVQDLYNLTAVSSPTFTADRGYAGDGASAYLDSNLNLSTVVGNFTRDSAHFGLWDLTSRAASASQTESGVFNSTTFQTNISTRFTGNLMLGRVNHASGGQMQPAVTGSSGFYIANRSGASAQQAYKDGAQLTSNTTASVALSNGNASLPFLSGRNVGGSAINFSSDQIAAATIGGSLNSTEVAAFYTAVLTYLQTVGAA